MKMNSNTWKFICVIIFLVVKDNFSFVCSRLKSEQNMKSVNNGDCSDKKYLDSSEEDKKDSPEGQSKSHQIILGDTSTAVPNIDIEVCVASFPVDVTLEKINLFKKAYQKHCEVSILLNCIFNIKSCFKKKKIQEICLFKK